METRKEAVSRVLFVSFAAALSIAIVKVLYGKWSGSLAFLADGIHSSFDSLSTLVAFFSFRWSSKPPDRGHPYGHRKFELVAVLILSLFLGIAGYEVGLHAWEHVAEPPPPTPFRWSGVGILAYALLVNFFLARWGRKVGAEQQSAVLLADAAHNWSDFFVTAAVLASVVCTSLHIPWVDSAVSLGIAGYLFFLGVQLLRGALRPLVDASVLDPEKVRAVVEAIDGVSHCHHVRSRGEPGYHFLDLNIHLPGGMTLEQAHEIAHRVEHRLKETFPGLADVVVHAEPEGHRPCADDDEDDG